MRSSESIRFALDDAVIFLCFQDLAEEAGETLIARLNPYSDGPQRTSTLLKTSGRPQVQLSLVQQGL